MNHTTVLRQDGSHNSTEARWLTQLQYWGKMSHTTALRINTRKCTARSVYRMMYSTVHCKLYMNDLCLNNGKFQDSLWVNGRCINERVLITVRYPPIFCKHSLFVSFASLLVQYTGILFPYVLYVCTLVYCFPMYVCTLLYCFLMYVCTLVYCFPMYVGTLLYCFPMYVCSVICKIFVFFSTKTLWSVII